jgi:hypothetical protein
MQSFTDLNNYSNTPVSYGTSADYIIEFGANAGNLSVSESEGSYFLIYKRVPLLQFSNVSKDLLVEINSSAVGIISDVVYFGSNTDIAIYASTSTSWAITGIRSVADYDDVFNNTYVGIVNDATGSFDLTFVLDDQMGNTRSYVASITIVPNTLFAFSSPIYFAEDTLATFGNLAITDIYPGGSNYTLNISMENPVLGQIKLPNGTYANSYTLTDTKTNVNTAITSMRFAPAADSLTNTQVNTVITRVADSKLVARPILCNWNGTSHSDYSIPVSFSTTEDSNIAMTGMSITDIRPDNIDANIQYQVTVASSDSANILISYNGSSASSAQITGTKSSINTILGNANLTPKLVTYNDFNGTNQVTYTQVNTTNSITQADSIPITVFVTPGSEYSITTTRYLTVTDSGSNVRIDGIILDSDVSAVSYTENLSKTSGAVGNFIVNGSSLGTGPITLTDSKANLNSSNVTFSISTANVANSVLSWSLIKNKAGNVQVPLASNVAVSLYPAISSFSGVYPYISNNSNLIFPINNRPVINSNVPGPFTLTLATSSGYFGTTQNNLTTSFVISGTAGELNTAFASILFYPNSGVSGNVTATFVLTSGGTTWVNRTISLTGTAGNVPANLLGVTTLTSPSGVYTVDLRQQLYCNCDILLVGGGGGGAWGGAGGGGGGAAEFLGVSMPGNVAYQVGRGGQSTVTSTITSCGGTQTNRYGNGAAGGGTSILSYSVNGGQGGITALGTGKGGNVGLPQTFTGGNMYTNGTYKAPGGGAGTNGNGETSTFISSPANGGNATVFTTVVSGRYGAGGPADAWGTSGSGSGCTDQIFQWTTWPTSTSPFYGRGGAGVYSSRPTSQASTRVPGVNGVIFVKWTQKP